MLNILVLFIYLFINSFNPLKVATLIFLIFLIPEVNFLHKFPLFLFLLDHVKKNLTEVLIGHIVKILF